MDFSIFASKILSKEKASKCSEANIIIRFRRGFAAYRTEEVRVNTQTHRDSPCSDYLNQSACPPVSGTFMFTPTHT